jgi:hypothetical protein
MRASTRRMISMPALAVGTARGNDAGRSTVTSFFVRHISGRTALLLAVLFYGAGLALPLGLHWPTLPLVLYNLGGTLLGALVLFAWFVVRIEAARRRELVDWTTSLRLLTAEEFEWLVGEIFRREGFQVEETGRQEGPDGNVDLRLSKDGNRRSFTASGGNRGLSVLTRFASS